MPDVVTPAGTVQVKGRVAAPPSRLYEFSAGTVHRGLPASGKISTWLHFAPPRNCRCWICQWFSWVSLVKACSATGLSSPRASINTMVTHFNGSGFAA